MKKYIVLHHSAIADELPQAERVKQEHLQKFGQAGSYHYFIERSGALVQFHDEEFLAYHAGNWLMNMQSIGICLAGDLRPGIQEPTAAQLDTLNGLVSDIERRRNILADGIYLHKEVRDSPTACPGRDLREYITKVHIEDKRLPALINALKWAQGLRRIVIERTIKRLQKSN